VFSNVRRVLSQYKTWLSLLYLLNKTSKNNSNNDKYMRMNLIPQGKEIILFCHPTWLPSHDRAKPLLDCFSGNTG
jgi:hypothetical protein